jgi:hypothetical protein
MALSPAALGPETTISSITSTVTSCILQRHFLLSFHPLSVVLITSIYPFHLVLCAESALDSRTQQLRIHLGRVQILDIIQLIQLLILSWQ